MTGERRQRFNKDVESYRRALLYHARTSDWGTFKAKAGRMFDYLESIEFFELERRFFKHFSLILAALIVLAVALFKVNFEVAPELLRIKNLMILAGLAIGSYELFFYINYRTYLRARTGNYAERREKFIRNIEEDFRTYAVPDELSKAA